MMKMDGFTALTNSVYFWIIVLIVFYFALMYPQRKSQKKEDAMRSSIEIGDKITTIGGIVGVVVSSDESKADNANIVIQTADSTRITLKRGAIRSKDTLQSEEETEKIKPAKGKA